MAEEKELNAGYNDFASSNETNALNFFVSSLISKIVSTSLPVVVTAVERSGKDKGAGYVSVKPLLQPRNNKGQGLQVTNIPKLPYFRLQHGKAAVICDPKVGDIGLAVVAKNDISNINGDNTPKVPATFRQFDPSDSFYIGGFWGKAPEVFIHLEDEGTIAIEAPQEVTIKTKSAKVEAQTMEVTASSSFTVTAPQINLNGAISGGGAGGENATFSGDVTAQGISLTTHTHTGVQSGDSSTGQPE
ncbi:phage baseplate assembly protein [Turicimonas sp. TL08]